MEVAMILRLRSISRAALVLVCASFVTVSCEEDDDGGGDHGGDEPAVCTEISDVCHDLDDGSGMAHECHELAHAGVATDCEAMHDECIAFCESAATGEGSGGSSGG
jgi:hypothetical protein